ncbi:MULTISPECIES: sigma-70 family RNA polymerase sigma factor [Clostridium]|uniref:Sigma-70 family RNA polymerase sigma factor n=1 Tax=Clostridium cibarium TaxID=2762247 RepID=A0ABR8PQ40_9CLOT|nr:MULTISPECIES: sigma-70 family RNA polymerase sigma factor [Clostridium]MBD7910255.1 sigma-70 family RNA polymerase sigma factor [Clostridium cibarium]
MINNSNFINQLKLQNPDALLYVLDNFGNLVYRIAYSNLRSNELSEECVNIVLFKVWNCINHFDYSDDKFKNWISAIAKYTSIDMLRMEKKHFYDITIENLVMCSKEDVEKNIIEKEKLQNIKNQICNLKEIDKNICIEKFFNNKSLKEIGEMYGMTPNAVALRIIRARKKLKTLNMDSSS